MTTFVTKDLYGGAMTVQLPKDYIDASDLRQIPDHQEVFLSPTTLTSLIFEINQYLPGRDVTSATHFHFTDVISAPDRLAQDLAEPNKITLPMANMKDFSASVIQGGIISREVDKKAPSNLPIEWQQNPEAKEVLTKVFQLLVRMEKYETDFCVRLNVPMKEMQSQEDADKEENFAKEMMEKIVGTLEVKDFGLFGTEYSQSA